MGGGGGGVVVVVWWWCVCMCVCLGTGWRRGGGGTDANLVRDATSVGSGDDISVQMHS